MADKPVEYIYRAMQESQGMPQIGATATRLSIRAGKDIEVDQAGDVHRPQFKPGGKNGLSCSGAISELPRFALPLEWGGMSKNTVVWRIKDR